ncbi:MAG: 30S ribosomal protein S19 [ANME-2 cluster archaeon]|nr:30S ribosomal protein S19 [ANME-2 cluster archaeon]MBC2700040.1 30S ribosomal protein S19 [ANME-2 cluster archaeon]MBC2707443.1 30S ribosomal protein S19 [ANME-2 cluster archaeon]MBC2746336.1 30S ribosomal protein S19 [ANME-2 cluster archaeon]MBC2763648.1 30S ribosomal protein S19 [ANME-2 cluster archaeon]
MAKKSSTKLPKRKGEFTYRGKTIQDLKSLSLEEFAELLPARQRRTINRGLGDEHKKILNKINDGDTTIKTHLRDMIILPGMVGLNLEIHNGKSFEKVEVIPEMLGHYFGEYSFTRKRVSHGSAGVGATKSSKFVPLK